MNNIYNENGILSPESAKIIIENNIPEKLQALIDELYDLFPKSNRIELRHYFNSASSFIFAKRDLYERIEKTKMKKDGKNAN